MYHVGSTGVLSAPTATPLPSGSQSAPFVPSTGIAINDAGTVLYLQRLFDICTFSIDATSGALSLLQTLSLPTQLGEGIALDPKEHFLYAADRSSIRAYGIDPVSGLLSLTKSTPQAQGGAYTLALSPNGSFAYTIENNNDLVSYSVSEGSFTPVGPFHSGVYGAKIAVDPSGSFVYVPQACMNCPSGLYNVVHQFSISQTGALAPLTTPIVAAGTTPYAITVTTQ